MVTEIPLSVRGKYSGMVALVDDEDVDLVGTKGWVAQKGGLTFYASRKHPGDRSRKLWMHRVILPIPVGMTTDHLDLNGLNNCRSNIRIATNSQNAQNRGLLPSNKSGYLGVSWHAKTGRWRANIAFQYHKESLGLYHDPIEAALAYDARARFLFGKFARTNFPIL